MNTFNHKIGYSANYKNTNRFENAKNYSLLNQKPKRIYCYDCNEYTEISEPILIRRYNKQTFSILAMCKKCSNIKQCAVSDDLYEKFPLYYFDLKLSKYFLNEVVDKNGIKHKLEKDLVYIINEPIDRRN